MGLATALGYCWSKMATTVPSFRVIPGRNVMQIGGRDFDPGEREMMQQAGITVIDAHVLRRGVSSGFGSALAAFCQSTGGAYVHVDLDVLDPNEAPVNVYQKPGGLAVDQLTELLDVLRTRVPVRAAACTAYDPSHDPLERTVAAAQILLRHLVPTAKAEAPKS